MDIQQIQQIQALFDVKKRVAITTHKSPDGDAIGSSLALYHYLKKKGHDVNIITPDDYPEFLFWLPGNNEVITFYNNKEKCQTILKDAEAIFCLDYNALHRIGEVKPHVESSEAVKIMIDHHREPDDFADFAFTDITASSTAQMIYEFIESMGDVNLLDREIGDCLYTGIVTDTGSFKFSSTSARTHEIAATIISKGSETTTIHNLIYDNSSEHRLRLLGYALSSKLEVYSEYNTAIISLNKEELKRFKYRTGDTEGIVNYALSIKGIQFAILITEKNNEARLSLRSKGNFSVNEFAKAHFNGGGHKNAAGGIDKLPVSEVIKKIVGVLPEYQGELF